METFDKKFTRIREEQLTRIINIDLPFKSIQSLLIFFIQHYLLTSLGPFFNYVRVSRRRGVGEISTYSYF